MKKIILSLFAFGALALTNSCTSDPCKDKVATDCKNGGTWVANGSTCNCSCAAGYTGSDCSTLIVTSVIGTYVQASSATSGSNTQTRAGSTKIEQDASTVSRVKITNLNQYFACTNGGSTTDVVNYGTLTDASTITLDNTAACGQVFTGKGVKQTNGSWIFNYTVVSGSTTYTCVTTLTK